MRVRSADGPPLARREGDKTRTFIGGQLPYRFTFKRLLVPDMLMSILEFGFQSTCYDGRD